MPELVSRNTILVVDDAPINRELLTCIFEGYYDVITASNGLVGLEKLKENSSEIAAIMLDLNMPVLSGFDFLQEYHGNPSFCEIPVIVATAEDTRMAEKLCLELGAVDFVSIPYDPNIILYRVKNAIDKAWFQTKSNDILTGIYNKERFQKETTKMLLSDLDSQYVFVTMDIDNFKAYNSYFGVPEGDKLIQFIGGMVTDLIGRMDNSKYARYSADVFNMCFKYDEDFLQELVGEFVVGLSNYNTDYRIKPTFGAYVIDDPYLDIELMHDRAVLAAKQCKGKYKEYISYYDSKMNAQIISEQQILNDIEKALAHEEFVVYYQPKFSLRTGQSCGAEALVRWQHPKRGLVPPGEFIPVFEKNGFITRLDYYVWEKTCRFLRKCLDEDGEAKPISVNVAVANLYNPNFVETLYRLLEKYDIPKELLNLEFTESAAFENIDIVHDTLNKLHELGFVIFMDDFGSGYSSLSVLKELPVDVLKIDRKFLPKNPSQDKGGKILAAVIRMANWLKMPVIVEGAETAEQISFLRETDCDYVQGFYFARPMPEDEYCKLLHDDMPVEFPYSKESKSMLTEIWTSDALVDKLFENIAVPTAVVAFDGINATALRMNHAFYNIFGHDFPADFATLLEKQIVGKDMFNMLFKQFIIVASSEESSECECRFELNGNSMWFRVRIQYIEGNEEKHILTMLFSDITADKITENALIQKETETKFQEKFVEIALNSANLIAWEYDINEHSITTRDGFRDLFGFKGKVLNVPQSIIDGKIVHSEDIDKLKEIHEKMDRGIVYAESMLRMRAIGGTDYRHYNVRYTNTYDAEDKPYKAIGLVQDISAMQEIRNNYFIEMEFNKSLQSDTIAAIMMNLDQRKIEKFRGSELFPKELESKLTYDNLREVLMEYLNDDEEALDYAQSMSTKVLKNCYENNKKSMHYEFIKIWHDSGKKQWIELELFLRKRPETGDVIAIGYLKDIDERVREKARLEEMTHQDQMTGLYHHEYTMNAIKNYLRGEGREGIHALLMIDLDDFKKINDTYGHIIGDKVIVEMAKRLKILFRKTDIIGRFGGDEFVVLMKNVGTMERIEMKAEQLREQLLLEVESDEGPLRFTSCIGISICEDADKTYREMIEEADKEMYKMKKSGKNNYSICGKDC